MRLGLREACATCSSSASVSELGTSVIRDDGVTGKLKQVPIKSHG